MLTLFLLFISAFGAATLLPLQSEAVLISLLLQNIHSASILLFIASLGNILGSCLNWYLGFKVEKYKHKKWFPVSEANMSKAQATYQKYGYWSLLLSWLPIIGDPITLVAGFMRENFARFLVIVSIAKIGRYIFIYLLFKGVF